MCFGAVAAGALAPPAHGQAVGRAATEAVAVSVVRPEPVTVIEELRLSGTLVAQRHAQLSTRVDGLIAEVRVDAGDRVSAGDPLLEVDPELARHALRRAEAAVAESRARVAEAERLIAEAERLIADRHIPETELARRQAEANLARASLEASEAAAGEQRELLRRHTLPAPFDGFVARRMADIGEWVVRGTPVLELVSTETVWLEVQAPQERFTRIDESAPVQVFAAASPGRPLPARILATVPVSDPTARTFLIRILVDGTERSLLPGTSATAVIRLTGGRSALSVPREAVVRYPDGSHSVFVVASADGADTARERRVTIGADEGADVRILQGLEPGERVVVRGRDALRDGAAVRVAADS